ncbi:MAG: DmsE family decaheme c-type cytochrome [Acidobacteriaceae bacterium]|nr:DmsE family decaheme c-type cytochrome [Acidobacteriaceae bacterium]MBV9778516.1 DmsE family decaheme c-type cytochrome [Acidobacteriaceae bacterium]
MTPFRVRPFALLRWLGVLLFACVALKIGAASGNKQQNLSPLRQPSDPALYVGADTCKTCHQPEAESYNRGPHWRTETGKHKGPQWQGCEACHGPGKAHVDSGGDATKIIRFTALSAREASERCAACHEKSESHANFMRSPHLANGVGCTTCHSIHAATARHDLLVSAQPALCYGCHRDVESDFAKPQHHRVNEGLMSCTDCHNPHGAFLPHNLRTSSWQGLVCSKCHIDTAGPFIFEHAPVKEQGCTACHNPHGSANPHLLTRPQVNQICLECHSTILPTTVAVPMPTFHNQATQFSQCVLCHPAIHGSNTHPEFFKR